MNPHSEREVGHQWSDFDTYSVCARISIKLLRAADFNEKLREQGVDKRHNG